MGILEVPPRIGKYELQAFETANKAFAVTDFTGKPHANAAFINHAWNMDLTPGLVVRFSPENRAGFAIDTRGDGWTVSDLDRRGAQTLAQFLDRNLALQRRENTACQVTAMGVSSTYIREEWFKAGQRDSQILFSDDYYVRQASPILCPPMPGVVKIADEKDIPAVEGMVGSIFNGLSAEGRETCLALERRRIIEGGTCVLYGEDGQLLRLVLATPVGKDGALHQTTLAPQEETVNDPVREKAVLSRVMEAFHNTGRWYGQVISPQNSLDRANLEETGAKRVDTVKTMLLVRGAKLARNVKDASRQGVH